RSQHAHTGPFHKALPHRPSKDERRFVQLAYLEQLPDHHRLQHRSYTSWCNDVCIRREYEVVQPGEEGPVLKDIFNERIRLLLKRQVNPDTNISRPLGRLRALIGGLHQTGAAASDNVAVHGAKRRTHLLDFLVDYVTWLCAGGS